MDQCSIRKRIQGGRNVSFNKSRKSIPTIFATVNGSSNIKRTATKETSPTLTSKSRCNRSLDFTPLFSRKKKRSLPFDQVIPIHANDLAAQTNKIYIDFNKQAKTREARKKFDADFGKTFYDTNNPSKAKSGKSLTIAMGSPTAPTTLC